MDSPAPDRLSPLARRLLGAQDDLAQRLSLLSTARDADPGPPVFRALLNSTAGWPRVLAVIQRAVDEQRPTLVFGDYDVDGAVASHLLHRALRSLGVPGNVFLPSRLRHGYGLDAATLAQAASQGYRTLLALDCGTANLAEIAQAQRDGLEVAVIDHHAPAAGLPDCPLLNPHLEADLPPFCTAGLAYHVLHGLIAAGLPLQLAGDEVELAGLATIADVVPLVPHNWLLAHLALSRLPQTVNAGLQELLKVAALHGLDRLTARNVAFALVPRLNAAGRLRSMRIVLDLLKATERATAATVAAELNRLNQERKRIGEEALKQALLQAVEQGDVAALALYDPQWHPGILGIVAAQVADVLSKPTAVLGDAPGQLGAAGVLTGSVRTAGGIDAMAALSACTSELLSFGGHSQAAGLKLQRDRLAAFRGAWSAVVTAMPPQISAADEAELPEVNLTEMTAEFDRDLWELAPFGPGYPPPRFILRGCQVSRVSYMGQDRTHLNIILSDGVRQARVAGFSQSHLYERLSGGGPCEAVLEVEPDNWNNRLAVMLRLIRLLD